MAQAGSITIETQVTAKLQGNADFNVGVTIKNKGDETAHAVYAETRSSESVMTSALKSSLTVGESVAFFSHHSLKGLRPGVYPLIVYTHYSDANGYGLSALSVSTLPWGKTSGSGILATLENADLFKEGRISLRVKNASDTTKKLRIRLLTPIELTAEPALLEAPLSSQKDARFTFLLHNFSALPGSNYFVNAVIEYDQEGTHFTSLTPAHVSISKEDSFLKRPSTWLGLLGFVFAAVLIGGRTYLEARRSK